MRIKAVTVWQPWASLLVLGAKEIETRGYPVKYRGLLAIHAAKRWQGDQEYCFDISSYRLALGDAGIKSVDDLHLGHILGVVSLDGMFKTESLVERLRQKEGGGQELGFGDYRPGRWGWYMRNQKRLKKPIYAKGSQGLWWWDVPDRVVKELKLNGG